MNNLIDINSVNNNNNNNINKSNINIIPNIEQINEINDEEEIIKRDYLPSPSPTDSFHRNNENNTPSTNPTPNRTPNPIPTIIPNTMTFQPLLTSINNINNNNNNNIINNNNNIKPSIVVPLPTMKITDINSMSIPLPPLPLNDTTNKRRRNKINPIRTRFNHHYHNDIKSEIQHRNIRNINKINYRNKPKSASSSISTSISSSSSSSNPSFEEIASAFNHNLKVKQEHLKEEPILDTLFEDCYIFSMICPYPNCRKQCNDMQSYQNHHIEVHQKRDNQGLFVYDL